MTLVQLLEQAVQKYSRYPALTMRMGYRTHHFTYQEAYNLARQTALFLQSNGIKKGDPVLICAPNSPYWICVFWGCMLIGARAVPLNIQITQDIITNIIQQTGACLLFKHQAFTFPLPPHVKEYIVEFLPEIVCVFNPTHLIMPEHNEDDILQILYTSGTTGAPKGVLLTHKNIVTNLTALGKIISLRPAGDERMLSILPLSHVFEQTIGFLLPLTSGAHVIYAHSHAAIRPLLKQYTTTSMLAVPEFLHLFMSRLETHLEEQGKLKRFLRLRRISHSIGSFGLARILFYPLHKALGGKLTLIASGGAPLDPELEQKWRDVGIHILQGYGLTETSPVLTCNTYAHNRLGSVGRLLDGVQAQITPSGEILVKGDSVFQGYYKNKEKTAAAFTADGWFKTGDIGYFDADDFLFLKGRSKYMILSASGQNVFPEDIEQELNKISGIRDSCVIGLYKEHHATLIHAVLLIDPESTTPTEPQQVILQVNEKLASYQHINSWSVWPDEDFPRTPTKKIKKEPVIDYVTKSIHKKHHPMMVITSRLMRVLSSVTGVPADEIQQDTKILQGLNVDSLMRVEIIDRLEEMYGIFLDEHAISDATTVEDLEKYLETANSSQEKRTLGSWPEWLITRWIRLIGQLFLFLFARLFIRLRVEGIEHIRNIREPIIFMPNHLSYADSLVVGMALPFYYRNRISFAAAQDFLFTQFSLLAPLARLLFNAFPFPRTEQENIKIGLNNMGHLIDKGFSVVIFPEGKMSETGALLPLKRGAGLVALEMGCRIVPIRIQGINAIFPYDAFFPRRRGTVTISFGQPMTFKKSESSYLEATDEIRKALEKL